jgi:hypothetical protein
MSTPDYRTCEAQEAWLIARIKRNPIITDWEATENRKRAAAWARLYERGVIRAAKEQPEYPYNKFEIHEPFSDR